MQYSKTKSALYAEILAEECEADPGLNRLLGLEPSTETLVVLIRCMVRHFQGVSEAPDQEESQRLTTEAQQPEEAVDAALKRVWEQQKPVAEFRAHADRHEDHVEVGKA